MVNETLKVIHEQTELPLEVTVKKTKRPICAKCRVNEVCCTPQAPMHTICEPCYWKYLDNDIGED